MTNYRIRNYLIRNYRIGTYRVWKYCTSKTTVQRANRNIKGTPKSTVQPESLNSIVWGFKSNPISQAKEQTIYQLSAEDENLISSFRSYHFMGYGWLYFILSSYHRVPTPSPLPLRGGGGGVGRNHLTEEICPLLPAGIGERLSQTKIYDRQRSCAEVNSPEKTKVLN